MGFREGNCCCPLECLLLFFQIHIYIVSSNHRIHDETIMPSENKLDLFCDSPVERHWVSGRCFLLMIVSEIVSTTAALLFGGMIVPMGMVIVRLVIVSVVVSTTFLFLGVLVSVVMSTTFLFLGVLVSMVVSTTFLSMIVSVGMVVVFVFLPVIMAVLVSTAASVIVLVFVFLGLSVILVVVAAIVLNDAKRVRVEDIVDSKRR